jgi:hypothetical protein
MAALSRECDLNLFNAYGIAKRVYRLVKKLIGVHVGVDRNKKNQFVSFNFRCKTNLR